MSTYYELVIKGDDRDVIPYLTGYMAGGRLSGIFFESHAGFRASTVRDRIRHRGEVVHIVCEAAQLHPVREALLKAKPQYDFEVKEEHGIARAYFPFDFETPSRKVAAAIRAVMEKLPPGVLAADYTPEEIVNPGARGSEVYSPTHEFVFRGRGVIEGAVGGVIETHAALSDIEFVNCEDIALHRT